MTNKITIDLDFDQVSELVRTSLIQDYELSLVQWPYDEVDKNDKLLESLKEVIEYYSTPEQYKEWQKTLEKGDEPV